MVEGSDRVELEIEGDGNAIAAMLKEEPYLREVELNGNNKLTLGADNGPHVVPKIIDRVEAAGASVTSISVHRLSLEDVFIRFTGRSLRDEPAKKVSFLVGAGMPQSRG
jgi:ABC-2 type transport system ATP-binding protein